MYCEVVGDCELVFSEEHKSSRAAVRLSRVDKSRKNIMSCSADYVHMQIALAGKSELSSSLLIFMTTEGIKGTSAQSTIGAEIDVRVDCDPECRDCSGGWERKGFVFVEETKNPGGSVNAMMMTIAEVEN